LTKLLGKIGLATKKGAPASPLDFVMAMRDLHQMYREYQLTSQNLKRIEKMNDLIYAEMNFRYSIIHEAMDRVFAERRDVIAQFFAIIERAWPRLARFAS